ncbi:MAG: AMP-binding protein, partial [Oscillospiraceae bacterium]|nr:AMP-binding protein [Oscillospiraceae bacterium]
MRYIMEYTYEAEKFKKIFESRFTWLNGFMRNVRRFRNKTAMIDPSADKKWSYTELDAECNKLANGLKAGGVSKNDVVLYQLLNSPQFAFCYIAPQKLGAINSPANFNLAAGETARIMDHDRPKAYIYDCDIKEMAWQALELSSYKPDIIIAVDYQGSRPLLPEGHVFYTDFVAGQSDKEPVLDAEPNIYDEVTRLFTSGTTGLPKGIPLNNVNEVMSAHDVIMHFPLNPHDITMNMTPWFHRGGLHSGGLTPTLYVGGTCVILRIFSAKSCLEYAVKYGVTFLIGVPAVLNHLAARQERHPLDLSELKGIVTMGSPLEKNACIRYQQVLTPNIFNGYGTTETFWNSFLRPYDLPEMSGTAGRSCTDDEVRIVKTYDNKRAEPDDIVPMDGKTTGEIVILSYFKSSLSYLDNPQLTEEKYYKGWLYTHDLGTWDPKQFISVSGRKDDMIISKGENIYPTQIEEVINQHPDVKDCIVTGVPDPVRGEVVVAYVIRE